MALTLTMEGTTSLLQANFMPPIVLEGNWVIGLLDFHTYYSVPNVDESNNVIVVGDQVVRLPTGTYELEEINEVVNFELRERMGIPEDVKDDPISIRAINSILKTEIKSPHDVDLSLPRSVAPLLGFDPKFLEKNKRHVSDRPVNILQVDDIRIECSIAAGSFDNGQPSHVIYGFHPDVSPGYKIVQRPGNITFYGITTNVISDVRIRIVDQKNRLINFRGENITVRLRLQQQQP